MPIIDCTPSALLEEYKCLECFSDSQIWLVLIVILAQMTEHDLPDELPQLLEDSACLNCLTESQKFQGAVAILGAANESTGTQAQLNDMVKCLQCASNPQVKALALFLWCEFWNTYYDSQRQ